MGKKDIVFIAFLLIITKLQADFLSAASYSEIAKQKRLAESDVWHALVHSHRNDTPAINHSSFLLSYPHFTPQRELSLTLEAILDRDDIKRRNTVCKYPARAYWLKQQLHLPDSVVSFQRCKAFSTYLDKTSDENISLVFASENVANPSSMMGHTFFKISGRNRQGRQVAHAISFYTVIDTVNIPWLILKSTLLGMPGFFSLTPYREQVYRNNTIENRNIWEYALKLDNESKRLLYYHFWELKDVKLTYLFTGYNCATIIHDMLSLTAVKPKSNSLLWITPKDLVKEVNRLGLVRQSKLLPSDVWYIKMLLDIIPDDKEDEINNIFREKNFEQIAKFTFSDDPLQKTAEKSLFVRYGDYLYRHQNIDRSTYRKIQKYTFAFDKEKEPQTFDLSQYKNPLKSPGDSRVTFGYDSTGQVILNFLPAANTLSSDNRQYFSERALKIGELSIAYHHKKLRLEKMDLYNVLSLVPWDSFTRKISFGLKLNYERHFDKELNAYHAYNMSLGGGFTKQAGNDLFLFSLFHVGFGHGKQKSYWYTYPEAGLILYEIWHMKSLIRYRYIYHQHRNKQGYHHVTWTQSLFLSKKHSLEFQFDALYRANITKRRSLLRYVYTF